MGTSFAKFPIIDDDHIFDAMVSLAPSDTKIDRLAKKLRGHDPQNKWRGLTMMYEAFTNFRWKPNADLVEREYSIAKTCDFSDWSSPNEALKRIEEMNKQLVRASR